MGSFAAARLDGNGVWLGMWVLHARARGGIGPFVTGWLGDNVMIVVFGRNEELL